MYLIIGIIIIAVIVGLALFVVYALAARDAFNREAPCRRGRKAQVASMMKG